MERVSSDETTGTHGALDEDIEKSSDNANTGFLLFPGLLECFIPPSLSRATTALSGSSEACPGFGHRSQLERSRICPQRAERSYVQEVQGP